DPTWPDVERAISMIRESSEQAFQPFREHTQVRISEQVRMARDRALRLQVLPLYDHRCALCALRLRWHQLVEAEAAHVVPVEHSGVDDLRNALSLCRTHHWAFDRGLWTVDEDMRARVVEPPDDPEVDVESLTQLARKPIELPDEERLRPHVDALDWHRKHVFVGDAA
ncbi:MAG: HNH endonuclease, partial [Polyangiales bacterium]